MQTYAFTTAISKVLPLRLPVMLKCAVARIIGLTRLEDVYHQLAQAQDSRPITSRLLSFLGVRYRASDRDLARIPSKGAAIVVANHPFGMLEGALLHELLLTVRNDVKILANGILNVIPELRDMLIDVDPMAGPAAASHNLRGLREAYDHLASGGLLVVFPAGEVSHFQKSTWSIADPEWNDIVARLARMLARNECEASIVPVYIGGANSMLFQAAGLIHSRMRTALLIRELLNKRNREVTIRIGSPIAVARLMVMPSSSDRTKYLRWRTYLLAHREGLNGGRATFAGESLTPPAPPDALAADIAGLKAGAMLVSAGDLEVYIAGAAEIPNILPEIGRLRELTFRAAGEGTRKAVDLDRYDTEYLHLFIWNVRKQEIAGAYRLAGTDSVGRGGLYTAALFNYSDEFLNKIGPALELGRSFITPEYQRSFNALLVLWKGIGRYIADHPQYKVLFGAVSISDNYQPISRELMVSWLRQNAGGKALVRLVSSKRPLGFKSPGLPEGWASDVDELSTLIADIEPSQSGVPILVRQYLKLGGKFLAFNLDPDFSNTLDGLIVVDLTETDRKLLSRYLGAAEAAAFLEFQKGTYAA